MINKTMNNKTIDATNQLIERFKSSINQVSCYEELTEEERELISKDLFDLHRLPKKWRADAGQYYAYIEFDNGILTTLMSPDNRYEIDNNLYASNNYYPLDLDLTDKIERINNILNE